MGQHPSSTNPAPSPLVALLDEQSAHWRDGRRTRVEDLLARSPAIRDDPEGVLDLIAHEITLREREGDRPEPEEYRGRFPSLGDRIDILFHFQELFRTDGPTPLSGGAPGREGPPTAPAGYVVEREIGRGGMGVVYLARQVALNRRVALKVVATGSFAEHARLARIRIEAEAIARLQHPNIIQIFVVGEHDGRAFLALEYVEGTNLARTFARTTQAPRRVAAMVETLARAVHQVHRNGVIHRDLKPANILLTNDGTPKIADFGMAKLLEGDAGQTGSGEVLGTPSHMAPEQAAGTSGRIGPAAD